MPPQYRTCTPLLYRAVPSVRMCPIIDAYPVPIWLRLILALIPRLILGSAIMPRLIPVLYGPGLRIRRSTDSMDPVQGGNPV